MSQLPAFDWLGYGLDMTTLRPFDLKAVSNSLWIPPHAHPAVAKVLESVKKQERIIEVDKDTRTYIVKIGDEEYIVPRLISVSQNSNVQSSYVTYPEGSDAVRAFIQDSGVASRYLSVTTNNVSYFPLAKSLPVGNQFAFFNYNVDTYLAGLQQYLEFLNESDLETKISKLPQPFTEDPDVVVQYKEFFSLYGSHVISNASYGARYLLEVWASNKHADVNENFSRNVTASVKGVNAGGVYDHAVPSEEQYHTFNRVSQRLVSAHGGRPNLASALVHRHPDFQLFEEWTESISENPAIVSIKAIELWTLLADADSRALRNSASSIRDAFEYIIGSQGKDKYSTFITFEMHASWAELGILTASAVVVAGDADRVSTPPHVLLGPSKFRWGAEDSPVRHVFTVLEVTNDGSPIDLYISRGSGTAKVTIAGEEYANNGGTHIKFFSQVPVVPSD